MKYNDKHDDSDNQREKRATIRHNYLKRVKYYRIEVKKISKKMIRMVEKPTISTSTMLKSKGS